MPVQPGNEPSDDVNFNTKLVEITMEFCHPTGPVTYTTLTDVAFEEAPGQLFTMVFRDEWRTV